ncbi:MAG: acyltransferase family protein, partial [Spirochaetota bacterium]
MNQPLTGPVTIKKRVRYLDSIKVFLTMLVIAHHVSITYGGGGDWYITDPSTDETATLILTLFTAVNQTFFMGFFFFISAYFVPQSFDRKGAAGFVRDKLIRLGIPLGVFYLFLSPLLFYLRGLYYGELSLPFFRYWTLYLSDTAEPGPLWFVQALLLFSLLYALYRTAGTGGKQPVQSQRPFPTNSAILIAAVGSGLAAFVVRLALPVDSAVFSFKLGYFPLYILLFIAGITASRNGWLESLVAAKARPWFITACIMIVVLPVAMIVLGESSDTYAGGFSFPALMYAMWEPFVCFGIIFMLVVLFRSVFHTQGRLHRELSRSAYTVYILHPFFCMG